MNALDYAVVLLVACGAVYGVARGAMRMLTSAVSLIGAIYVASAHYEALGAKLIALFSLGPAAAKTVAYISLFVVVFAAVEITGSLLIHFAHAANLGLVDRLAGAALGASVAAVVAGLGVIVATATLPLNAEFVRESKLAPALLEYNTYIANQIPAEVRHEYEVKRKTLMQYWSKHRQAAPPGEPRGAVSETH